MKHSFNFKYIRKETGFKQSVLLILLILTLFISFSLTSFADEKDLKPEGYISGIVDPDGSLKRVMDSKVLRVGADPNTGMPYIKFDKKLGDYSGFETDIARFISSKMGCETKIVPTNWKNLLTGLDEKKYDIVLNAIEKPLDDKLILNKVGFSAYYYVNTQNIFINKNNKQIRFLSNLKNKKVGVLNTSIGKIIVSELNRQKKAGIILVMYSNIEDMFSSLNKKRIEAVVTDSPIGTWNCNEGKDCKKVGIPVFSQNYVIAVRKEDRALLNAIDAILRISKKDNKINQILKRWNLE